MASNSRRATARPPRPFARGTSAECVAIGEGVHRCRVAVDQRWSEASSWSSVYFRAAVLRLTTARRPSESRLRRWNERADEVPVEDLAGVLVDEQQGERLLDGDDFGAGSIRSQN